MEALKTLKGSKIWYSKYGVGKSVGSKIYVHRVYMLDIVPSDITMNAIMMLPNNFWFNCICYDTKKPYVVRFDACPGFDKEREPIVGWQCTVDIKNKTIQKKYCNQIFHHRWLWCKDDYTGFDVQAAYDWSKTWLQYITSPSGYLHKWNEELKKCGLPISKKG